MKAFILAGGKGTRLAPYTTIYPKPMLPVGGKPILEIIIHQLAHYGFNDITVSLGYLSELIERYFQNRKVIPSGVKLHFVKETVPLGTAGPVSLMPPTKDPFLVMNGDVLTSLNFAEFMKYHREKKAELTIAVNKVRHTLNLGIVVFDRDSKVSDYIEKPTNTYFDSMGIYLYSPSVLSYIKPRTRLDLPGLVLKLIADKKKVCSYHPPKSRYYWIDMGQHAQYEKANIDFLRKKSRFWP
jgi:NDP-mannose synthase